MARGSGTPQPVSDGLDDIIGPEEAGAIFGRSDQWARDGARSGKLPARVVPVGARRHTYEFSRRALLAIAEGQPRSIAPLDLEERLRSIEQAVAHGTEDGATESAAWQSELQEGRIRDLEVEAQALRHEIELLRLRARVSELERELQESRTVITELRATERRWRRAVVELAGGPD